MLWNQVSSVQVVFGATLAKYLRRAGIDVLPLAPDLPATVEFREAVEIEPSRDFILQSTAIIARHFAQRIIADGPGVVYHRLTTVALSENRLVIGWAGQFQRRAAVRQSA